MQFEAQQLVLSLGVNLTTKLFPAGLYLGRKVYIYVAPDSVTMCDVI